MFCRMLHISSALHFVFGKPQLCVTGGETNEFGRLAVGVTRVTPVTLTLEGSWICALILTFQIGLAPHFQLPAHQGDPHTTASFACVAQGTEPCCKSLEHLVACG